MLLSRIPEDPTVDGLRDKKEKCSTRSRLRVDSGIRSFFKLLEVGFSPYLSFYSHSNVLLMCRLNEAVRGRLIGPKSWDRIDRIFERKMEQPVAAPRPFRGCLGVVCLTCALNGCLICIGAGMAVDCGFTK